MKLNSLKSSIIVAIAGVALAMPLTATSQRYGHPESAQNGNRYRQDRGFKDLVDRTERESNSFRSDFERSYRGRDRGRNWNRNQFGFWGADLKSDIQRMDEAFERLRHDVDRKDWRNGDARREMDTVVKYSNTIDREFGRGFGNYRAGGRGLDSQWRDLKSDINSLAREFGVRRR